jgi:hypothetical protein
MRPKNEHLQLLRAFSDLCQKAYCSWHLVTSPVLAKIGLADLFHEYETGGTPPQPSKCFLLNRLVRYYVMGFIHFFLWLCCKIAHTLSAQRATIFNEPTVFIDTFFVIPNILKGADVLDHYFPGIKPHLKDSGWKRIMVPRFYGSESPFQFYRIFRYLRTSGESVLTEFQLLSGSDYLRLFWHMIIYPWRTIGLFALVPRSREGRFIHVALANGLNCGNLPGAVRYLMARRLAPLLPAQARCLQWFENQTFEKCFNRGLREAGGTMPIYGAQLFIWPPEIVNIHVDRSEPATNKPDVLLVNGPYFWQENCDIPCRVGPALRDVRLFTMPINSAVNKKTLVLLSYFEVNARLSIELAIQTEPPEELMFKFHPAVHQVNLKKLAPAESIIVDGDMFDVFPETGLMIGSASGALAVAAAVGIPVIVTHEKKSTHYTYIPDIGKGLLWEFASTAEQVKKAKEILFDAIIHRNDERMAAIEALRMQLFSRLTPDAILDCLDLRNAESEYS